MADQPMTESEIIENHGRTLHTIPTIIEWYQALPKKARMSLSLEHLHGLAKRLRDNNPIQSA